MNISTCSCEDSQCQTCFPKKRKRFSGLVYSCFEQTCNAILANSINELLDEDRNIIGDDGPIIQGNLHKIDEALEPLSQGISVRTIDNKIVTIFAYEILK